MGGTDTLLLVKLQSPNCVRVTLTIIPSLLEGARLSICFSTSGSVVTSNSTSVGADTFLASVETDTFSTSVGTDTLLTSTSTSVGADMFLLPKFPGCSSPWLPISSLQWSS